MTTSRRSFLVQAAVLLAAPLVAPMAWAQAAELKPLPLDNATAKALAYAEDFTNVQHPNFKPGSNCANCQFFTAGTGACSLFPDFKVPAQAWCSAWAIKAK